MYLALVPLGTTRSDTWNTSFAPYWSDMSLFHREYTIAQRHRFEMNRVHMFYTNVALVRLGSAREHTLYSSSADYATGTQLDTARMRNSSKIYRWGTHRTLWPRLMVCCTFYTTTAQLRSGNFFLYSPDTRMPQRCIVPGDTFHIVR